MKYYKKLSKEGKIVFLYRYSEDKRTIDYYIDGVMVKYSFGVPLPKDLVQISVFDFFSLLALTKLTKILETAETSHKVDEPGSRKFESKIKYTFLIDTIPYIEGYSGLDEEGFIKYLEHLKESNFSLEVKDRNNRIIALLNNNLISKGSFLFTSLSVYNLLKKHNKKHEAR